jgi:hypothetical protein
MQVGSALLMCEAGNTLIRVGDGFAVVAAIGTSLMMADGRVARIEQNMVSLTTPMQKLAFGQLDAFDFGRLLAPYDARVRSECPGAFPL